MQPRTGAAEKQRLAVRHATENLERVKVFPQKQMQISKSSPCHGKSRKENSFFPQKTGANI